MFCKIYYYENFDLSSLSASSLEVVIWGICAGIIIGTLCSIIYKVYTHSLFKQIIQNEIYSEAKACTLGSMKVKGKWYLRMALRTSDKPLRRFLVCANEDELAIPAPGRLKKFWYTKVLGTEVPVSLPMDKARFYMPEENRVKAELRFTEVRNPAGSFIFTVVLLVAVSFFAIYAVPELLQMLDNFLTTVKPTDSGSIL